VRGSVEDGLYTILGGIHDLRSDRWNPDHSSIHDHPCSLACVGSPPATLVLKSTNPPEPGVGTLMLLSGNGCTQDVAAEVSAPTQPSGNCHPSYPDFCIPPPPHDLAFAAGLLTLFFTGESDLTPRSSLQIPHFQDLVAPTYPIRISGVFDRVGFYLSSLGMEGALQNLVVLASVNLLCTIPVSLFSLYRLYCQHRSKTRPLSRVEK